MVLNYICLVQIEFPGLDGYGGPLYIGTGCFHRRETLCGRKYSVEDKLKWEASVEDTVTERASVIAEKAKILAGCSFEEGTEWGKEVCNISLLIKFHYKTSLLMTRLYYRWD